MSDEKRPWHEVAAELLAAATPGPWEVWEGHAEVFAHVTENRPGRVSGVEVCRCRDEDEWADEEGCPLGSSEADAALIAACPTLLTEALAEREDLDAELAQYKRDEDVADHRRGELESQLAHLKDCHGVTADALQAITAERDQLLILRPLANRLRETLEKREAVILEHARTIMELRAERDQLRAECDARYGAQVGLGQELNRVTAERDQLRERVALLSRALDAWLDWDRTAEADTSASILDHARTLTDSALRGTP